MPSERRKKGSSSDEGQSPSKQQAKKRAPASSPPRPPSQAGPSTSSAGVSSGPPEVSRGRAGYRTTELRTIPANVTVVRADRRDRQGTRMLSALSNFVELTPMRDRQFYKYRLDFDPNIESAAVRRQAFRLAREGILPQTTTQFDGVNDARSTVLVKNGFEKKVATDAGDVLVKAKFVGNVPWVSFEMLRTYNINTNEFLRKLGFFKVVAAGGYVHPSLKTVINDDIYMLRGFRTAVNSYDGDKIFINMEPYHKLIQANNVLSLMSRFAGRPNMQESIRSALIGRTVATSYSTRAYQIEDVLFNLTPKSTFHDAKTNRDITYMEYYKRRWDITISNADQFLLAGVQTSGRRREGEDKTPQNLIPELCNLSGLTEEQRNDFRIKNALLRSSQVEPQDRVQHMKNFLNTFHSNNHVAEALKEFGYNYANKPAEVQAFQFAVEKIGIGKEAQRDKANWPAVDPKTASFEGVLTKDPQMAAAPSNLKLAVLIARNESRDRAHILRTLGKGFERIGLRLNPDIIDMNEGNQPHNYVNRLRSIANDYNATIVVMTNQNKERYGAIKKLASVEKGMVTQVVTAKLMTDQKKAIGAALKIGVQVVAKVGGEPWYVNLPLKGAMFCGYDTYHDTAKRGRSFGAFVASVNNKYSRWFSHADAHDQSEELSAQISINIRAALKRYHDLNEAYPDRVFLYRDGVSDGQLEHVYRVELQNLLKEVKKVSSNIKLTVIVVNKRIGARFYMRSGDRYLNLPPGSVVDDVVTRKGRYDFYLISQSTSRGTVTPTYYNIIHDESGFGPHIHQAMAFKLTMLYYNWTGTVRVPAPCQYAHKLALLCGEHLHQAPNTILSDRLHFL